MTTIQIPNARTWEIGDLIIEEIGYNADLHAFEVYHDNRLLGTIYPDNIADMDACAAALNSGANPITDNWDDGLGNPCDYSGWGVQ